MNRELRQKIEELEALTREVQKLKEARSNNDSNSLLEGW